jgi:hypothetical protein
MGKRLFGHVAGEVSALGGPIAESRPESVNGAIPSFDLLGQRAFSEPTARLVTENELAACGLQGNRPPKAKNRQIRLLERAQSSSPFNSFQILHGRLRSVIAGGLWLASDWFDL